MKLQKDGESLITKRIITEQDLNIAFEIRKDVFVKEQGVPLEVELDEFDVLGGSCEHILVYHDGQAVGTGRITIVDGIGKLQRICILKPYRKLGLGKIIIQGLEEIAREKGALKAKLHGQTQAGAFYKKLGYEAASDIFMEEGIPHILMIKELS